MLRAVPSQEDIELGHKRLIHVLETTTVLQITCDYKQIKSFMVELENKLELVTAMAYCAVGVAESVIPDDFEPEEMGISIRVMDYYKLTSSDIDVIYVMNDVQDLSFKQIATELRKRWSV